MATGGITGTPESLDSWVPGVAGKGVAIGGPERWYSNENRRP